MISTQDSTDPSSLELALPPQFEKIEDVMGTPSDRLKKNPLVNVIGLVKDFQPPIATKGSDFKCTLALVDLSTQADYGKGVKVMIFWPEEKMPHISSVSDVVLLRKFKVQMWSGYISLLANWASEVHVFPAASIPLWPLKFPSIPFRSSPAKSSPPSSVEIGYAAWLFNHIDKSIEGGLLPDAAEFEQKTRNAMTVRNKYSLLKDIKADNFYDLIGEVIRVYERDGRVTVYISDYTAHPLFYNNVWGGMGDDDISNRDGDPFGYIRPRKKASNDWPGPYGKLSIQLTVYDNHAALIREQVKTGDWLMLGNVQIKMGNQGGCIEGFLREDRQAWEGKFQVRIIRRAEDAEKNDARWKEGIRRKKEWWDKFKKQKQNYLEEIEEPTRKRKVDETESSKPRGKRRRKELRAATEQKIIRIEQKVAEKLDLNLNVKCNNPDKQATSIGEIMKRRGHIVTSGSDYDLPFTCVKYIANVRVVDFWPNRLEDFSVGRRISEYDVLSDYSGGESTDNEEDMRKFRLGQGFGGEKAWEWRFALKVEDAGKKATKHADSMWLVVDNQAAQMLLNLDAVNLRQDEETLTVLREVLFRLWGDLEEKKSSHVKLQAAKSRQLVGHSAETGMATNQSIRPSAKPGDDLPPDSDDESVPMGRVSSRFAISERDPNMRPEPPDQIGENEKTTRSLEVSSLQVRNKGFRCCIQEYGVKVPEESSSRADAGRGMRWKRMFSLFGTTIV